MGTNSQAFPGYCIPYKKLFLTSKDRSGLTLNTHPIIYYPKTPSWEAKSKGYWRKKAEVGRGAADTATMAASCTYQESCPGLGDGLEAANSDAHQQPPPGRPQGFFLQVGSSLSWEPSAFLLRPPEMRGHQPKFLSVIQGDQPQSGPSSKNRKEWNWRQGMTLSLVGPRCGYSLSEWKTVLTVGVKTSLKKPASTLVAKGRVKGSFRSINSPPLPYSSLLWALARPLPQLRGQ